MGEIIPGESFLIKLAQERTSNILRHIEYKLNTLFKIDLGVEFLCEIEQFILDEVFSAMIDTADKAIQDPINHQKIVMKTSKMIGER